VTIGRFRVTLYIPKTSEIRRRSAIYDEGPGYETTDQDARVLLCLKSSPFQQKNASDIGMVSAMAETKNRCTFVPFEKGTLQRQSVIIEKLGFKWHTLASLHQMSKNHQNRGERTMSQHRIQTIEFE
jgi:hypothetical protein